MPELRPFYGWRYNPERVDISQVVAPPYDIVSREEVRYYLTKDPHNIFHLELGEDHPGDHEGENRYLRAKRYLETWIKEGILIRESRPALYLYQIHFTYQGRSLTRKGFIGLVRLSPFSERRILPHEKTFPKVTEDRFKLLKTTSAHFSQVFALYRDPEKRTVESPWPAKLLYRVTEEKNNIVHEFYVIEDLKAQQELVEEISPKVFYIADGHHRYTTALKYAEEMESKVRPEGPRCFHYLMMYFCPFEDPGLLVLPTHRVLEEGLPKEVLAAKLKEIAELQETDLSLLEKGPAKGEIFWVSSQEGLLIRIKPQVLERWAKESGLPEEELPAAWCSRLIELLYGKSEKELKETRKLHYTPWLHEIKEKLSRGVQAFLLPETSVTVLERVARSGKVMPHKSTYFYPKILTGFVIFRINPHLAPPCP